MQECKKKSVVSLRRLQFKENIQNTQTIKY